MILSIIIPHKNAPVLLYRCLHSLPDNAGIDIIIVDDGSDVAVQEEIIEVCPQIRNSAKVVSLSESHGGGHARNVGLAEAKGDYVLFSDCDDFFNYVIYDVVDHLSDYSADITFFNVSCIDSDTYEAISQKHPLNSYIGLWNTDKDKAEKHLRFLFGEPWCKLIKREVITKNNIKFDETIINNDTTFSYMVGYYAKNVAVDKRSLYCYTIRSGSVSRLIDKKRLFTKIDVFGRSELFFRSHGLEWIKEDRHLLVLYKFIKQRDYKSFFEGIDTLKGLGYDENDIIFCFSTTVAKVSLKAVCWCVVFTPIWRARLLCFAKLFTVAMPKFFKYNVLKYKQLKRY